jgi:glutamyl-tRNA reductase
VAPPRIDIANKELHIIRVTFALRVCACSDESAIQKPSFTIQQWFLVGFEMPRKVTPRWGETGVPSFTLDDKQVAEIGRHLGMKASAAISQLKATLEEIGARYRLWIKQDEKGPSWAEQNAVCCARKGRC